MKRNRGSALLATLVATLLLLPVARLRADVLEQVPADAIVVVKINNLKSVSDKVAKLAADLGLAAMAPQMADPLSAVQQRMKIPNGVNTAGNAAFVFFNPEQHGGDEDKSFLLLIPVADYNAFIGNWADAQTDAGISSVRVGPDEGTEHNGFVAQWGEYAAMSPLREIVENKPSAGVKFSAATSKELSSKDAVVVANIRALAPHILPKFKEGRERALQEMEQNLANDPQAAKFTPVAKAFMNQFMNAMEGYLQTSEAASLGISFNNDGILFTGMSEFQPDSYMGRTLSEGKLRGENLLRGLPSGKYLIFGGSVSDPQQTLRLIDDFAQPILQEVLAMGPEFKPAEDYYAALKDYVGANTGSTFGMFAPANTNEGVIQVVSINHGDAAKMADAYKRMAIAQEQLMSALGVPPEQIKVTFTENAKTVDGVTFDGLKSDINVPDAGGMNWMDMIYGPSGPTVYMGVVDGKLLQVVGSVKDESLSATIAATKAGSSPLADLAGVKSVAANLPQDHVAVMYVALDEIVNTGLAFARQFGLPVPMQLPPDLPPIGMSVSNEGPAIRIDTYVPSQLLQSMVAAGMQAAMQMQGGRQGGGGGL